MAVGGGAVAELAVLVPAPAVGGTAGEQGAGVEKARGDRGGGRDPRHRDRGEPIKKGAVAKLAADVPSPAVNVAAGEPGAGVVRCGEIRDAGKRPAPASTTKSCQDGTIPVHRQVAGAGSAAGPTPTLKAGARSR